MAGDWIKMRGNLWDDPRIAKLCDLTDQPEAMVVGGLYWLWASADQHTVDGMMPGLTLRGIDRKTGIQGFGQALVDVKWLADHPEGVRIINFEDHNGESAKRRCADAKRKAGTRTKSEDVPQGVRTDSEPSPQVVQEISDKQRTENGQVRTNCGAREREEKEKETEEKTKDRASALKPVCFSPPDWVPIEEWREFVKMRRSIPRSSFTDAAARGVVADLRKLVDQGHDAAELLRTSVVSSWKTVYAPRASATTSNNRATADKWAIGPFV